MTIATIDEFLLRNAPVEPRPVAPALLAARDAVRSALDDMRRVDDSALEKSWPFAGGEADVRYGLYRPQEILEDVRARIGALLGQAHATQLPARPLVAAAVAATWDLYGVLCNLADEDLDHDPANGEWTVRQTLGHIVSGQRAYAWGTTWWLTQRDAAEFPARLPQDIGDTLPPEEAEGQGSLSEIVQRMDDIVDLSGGALGAIDARSLAVRARWSGLPVDVRFRLVRWASHIREHTIQVEKTLGFIGRPTSEVERLLRLTAAAYGRLEQELFMLPDGAPGLDAALAEMTDATADIAETAKSVAAAV